MSRPKKGTQPKKRNDVVVKLDEGVVREARVVAAYRSITLAEYLSETFRSIVSKDLDAEERKRKEAR